MQQTDSGRRIGESSSGGKFFSFVKLNKFKSISKLWYYRVVSAFWRFRYFRLHVDLRLNRRAGGGVNISFLLDFFFLHVHSKFNFKICLSTLYSDQSSLFINLIPMLLPNLGANIFKNTSIRSYFVIFRTFNHYVFTWSRHNTIWFLYV